MKENIILGLLSDPLREQIFKYTSSGQMIQKCKVFRELYEEKILTKLNKFMDYKIYSQNDVIIQEGELTTQMYFMMHGQVEVCHSQTQTVFKILEYMDFFGEISFFTKKPRTATIRCVEIVETLCLQRENLDFVLFKSPVAALKTQKIEELCSNDDFTSLGIKCYLCKKLGHTASQCPHSRLSPIKLKIPQK